MSTLTGSRTPLAQCPRHGGEVEGGELFLEAKALAGAGGEIQVAYPFEPWFHLPLRALFSGTILRGTGGCGQLSSGCTTRAFKNVPSKS